MLKFDEFTGINNVTPEARQSGSDLSRARNVDVGLTRELRARTGYRTLSERCHKNLWQAAGFMLFTEGGHLTVLRPDGSEVVLRRDIGPERIWYANLPDGRVALSNGLIHAITDSTSCLPLGIDAPPSLGVPDFIYGGLDAGQYRYHLTYTRLADGIEGPAASSEPLSVAPQAGLLLVGLPQVDGFKINVYLSGKDGAGAYLAGSTAGSEFEFTGVNSDLLLPCRTLDTSRIPAGKYLAAWRGRVLVADDATLWASRPMSTHLVEWRDFKPLPAPITMVQPVDGGIYVGTTTDLVWLGGATWDALAYRELRRGPVVPGSGVNAPAHEIGEGMGSGAAMICIAGGEIVAGSSGGEVTSLTAGRYRADVSEVVATYREVAGIPQYVAVPQ